MAFIDLATIAQVSATLAGFATLASAIPGNRHDSDAIFEIVVQSLIALVFSLFALRLGSSEIGLRVIAAALILATIVALVRVIWSSVVAINDDVSDYDRTSQVLGYATLLVMCASPLLASLVAIGLAPARGKLLFEVALLSNVSAASLLLLDVVRRNLALKGAPPSA